VSHVAPLKSRAIPARKQSLRRMEDAMICPKYATVRQLDAFLLKDLAKTAALQLSEASGHPVREKYMAHLYVAQSTPQQNPRTDAHRLWREAKTKANASGFICV